jgi:hypothetical protein
MEKISQSEASALIQTSVFSILGVELALMETFHKTSPTPRTILLCPGLLPKKRLKWRVLLGIAPKLMFLETVSVCNACTVLQKVT